MLRREVFIQRGGLLALDEFAADKVAHDIGGTGVLGILHLFLDPVLHLLRKGDIHRGQSGVSSGGGEGGHLGKVCQLRLNYPKQDTFGKV